MTHKNLITLIAVAILSALPAAPFAQTEMPTVIVNELHSFEFKVQASSVVTYELGGEGFSAIYNSRGGGKGTQPDYGLIVYGTTSHRFSGTEALAAGFDPAVETTVNAADYTNQSSWQTDYSAQMAQHGRARSGLATVEDMDGNPLEIPFYSWAVTVGTRKAHALTYVVLHGTSFIHVQVESPVTLSDDNVAWLTTNLSLEDAQADST